MWANMYLVQSSCHFRIKCRPNLSPPAGKMQNYELVHSSKVKFIYPSEEEMGDLTFIVAERKTPASAVSSSPCSFNVLLYLLVFQVRNSVLC